MKPMLQFMAVSLAFGHLTMRGADKIVNEGERITITYGLSKGTPPFEQQWTKDGVPIVGATEEEYVIESAKASDAGIYRVKVKNNAGDTTSDNASISIVVRPAEAVLKIKSETVPQPKTTP